MYKRYEEVVSAKLIAYSQVAPTSDLQDTLEDVQDIIAYCAKVSNPQLQTDFSKVDRLMDYLKRNAHWSPFEMASATMEITTTRDIARQMLRHRSFSFQEFSQRYADTKSLENQFVLREARLQDNKNRQNSIEISNQSVHNWWDTYQINLIEHAKNVYNHALSAGIAKEQARVVLPEGNTVSKLYMQGTIRSWIHYIDLRSANGTQKEHMLVAKAIAKELSTIFE